MTLPQIVPATGNRQPATGNRQPATGNRQPATGDIVVTRVAGHYHVGRVQEDWEPFAEIATRIQLTDAIDLACRSVTGQQRVFLYPRSGSHDYVDVDCARPRDDVLSR